MMRLPGDQKGLPVHRAPRVSLAVGESFHMNSWGLNREPVWWTWKPPGCLVDQYLSSRGLARSEKLSPASPAVRVQSQHPAVELQRGLSDR